MMLVLLKRFVDFLWISCPVVTTIVAFNIKKKVNNWAILTNFVHDHSKIMLLWLWRLSTLTYFLDERSSLIFNCSHVGYCKLHIIVSHIYVGRSFLIPCEYYYFIGIILILECAGYIFIGNWQIYCGKFNKSSVNFVFLIITKVVSINVICSKNLFCRVWFEAG